MAMNRKIRRVVKSKPTIEGAGVHLRRAFGFGEVPDLDPFLLLDDFRSDDPEPLSGGFPLAPPSWDRDHHVCPRREGRAWRQHGK